MKLRAVISLLLLFTVTGCQSFGLASDSHGRNTNETGLQMILFYDKTASNSIKNNYLDALLEVVDKYPKENEHITIHSDEDDHLTEKYHLKRHPTLIVTENGKTKVRLEGHNNKSSIVKEVTKVIEKTKTN